MNETISTIYARRSVRFYEDRPIEEEKLKAVIDAGHAAPSGMNSKQWRFVAVTDKGFLTKLAALGRERYAEWIKNAPEELRAVRADIDAKVSDPVYYGAPAVVFVIGGGMTAGMDCPMVCQNMMLAARSLGLGSCWVYFGQLALDAPEIRAELELAENESVFGPILLGYPREGFPDRPQERPLNVKWI